MQSNETILSEKQLLNLIEPDIADLLGEQADKIIHDSREASRRHAHGKLDETTTFLMPVVSFLSAASRRAVNQLETVTGRKILEVQKRSAIGQGAARHIGQLVMDAGIFKEYHTSKGFGSIALPIEGAAKELSQYGAATFRDTAWVVGGVVSLLEQQPPEERPLARDVLGESHKLHQYAQVDPGRTIDLLQLLGKPYIDPRFLALETWNYPSGSVTQATFTPAARAVVARFTGKAGCPALHVTSPDPTHRGSTLFRDEWQRMTTFLTPDGATASLPIDTETRLLPLE